MSVDDVFDSFIEEEKDEKTAPEEATEMSQEPEVEAGSIPEGEDESKEEAEEEALAKDIPATEAVARVDDDWFEPAEEEPTRDKKVEEQPVEGETAGETPSEEGSSAETPAEVTEDWFEPAVEEQAPAETPSETGADRGALIRVKSSPIVVPAVTADIMRQQMALFQSLKASLLDKNTDIVAVQGKPYVKRSGWRKLALAFNISDEIIKEQKEEKGDDFEWRHWVRAWAPNGRSVVGIGACSSKERDFAHLEHDVFAVSHTRAKNRALSDLIGSGEVSWEELRGFN